METCKKCASLIPDWAKYCAVCAEPRTTSTGGPASEIPAPAPATEAPAIVTAPEASRPPISAKAPVAVSVPKPGPTDWGTIPAPQAQPLDPSASQLHWSTTAPKTNGLAVASLVLAILGFLLIPIVTSIVAIVLGIVAAAQIRNSQGALTGSGLATGGIVLGASGIVIWLMLFAIAIPTFMGARARAQDLQARSNAEKAGNAALAIFAETGDLTAVTTDVLKQIEPGLDYVEGAAPSSDAFTASMMFAPTEVVVATQSASGTCYYFALYNEGSGYGHRENAEGTCSAQSSQTSIVVDGWP